MVRLMPVMVIRRRTRASTQPCLREGGIDTSEIRGQTVELSEPALDGDALILLERLHGEPRAPLGGEEIAAVRQDQVRVQHALNAVLQARAGLDDGRAAGHLSTEALRCFVRLPDLRQKAGGMQLCEHNGVDLIGLYLRVRDRSHLQRVGDDNPPHMRRHQLHHCHRVPGSLDDDVRLGAEPPREGDHLLADEINPPEMAHTTRLD